MTWAGFVVERVTRRELALSACEVTALERHVALAGRLRAHGLPSSGPYHWSACPVTAARHSKSRSRCRRVSPRSSAVAATTRSTAPALSVLSVLGEDLLDLPGAVVGAIVVRCPWLG